MRLSKIIPVAISAFSLSLLCLFLFVPSIAGQELTPSDSSVPDSTVLPDSVLKVTVPAVQPLDTIAVAPVPILPDSLIISPLIKDTLTPHSVIIESQPDTTVETDAAPFLEPSPIAPLRYPDIELHPRNEDTSIVLLYDTLLVRDSLAVFETMVGDSAEKVVAQPTPTVESAIVLPAPEPQPLPEVSPLLDVEVTVQDTVQVEPPFIVPPPVVYVEPENFETLPVAPDSIPVTDTVRIVTEPEMEVAAQDTVRVEPPIEPVSPVAFIEPETLATPFTIQDSLPAIPEVDSTVVIPASEVAGDTVVQESVDEMVDTPTEPATFLPEAEPVIAVKPVRLQTSADSAHWDSVRMFRDGMKVRTTPEAILFYTGMTIYAPVRGLLMAGREVGRLLDKDEWHQFAHSWLHSMEDSWGIGPTYSAMKGLGLEYYQYGFITPYSRFSTVGAVGLYGRHYAGLSLNNVGIDLPPSAGFSGEKNADLRLAGSINYAKLADEQFYGIGPRSVKGDRSNYGLEQTNCAVIATYRLIPKVDVSLTSGWESERFFRGGNERLAITPDTLPGSNEKVLLMRFAGGVQYDSRDRKGNPRSGQEAGAGMAIYTQVNGFDHGFIRGDISATQYLHLFYDRTLALKVSAQANRPVGKQTIPFYHLAQVGENETLRGLLNGRYRDRDLIYGSIEYRYPVFTPYYTRMVDGVLFVDAGQVTSDLFSKPMLKDVSVSYGFGFRLYGEAGLRAKAELGLSREFVVLNLSLW